MEYKVISYMHQKKIINLQSICVKKKLKWFQLKKKMGLFITKVYFKLYLQAIFFSTLIDSYIIWLNKLEHKLMKIRREYEKYVNLSWEKI